MVRIGRRGGRTAQWMLGAALLACVVAGSSSRATAQGDDAPPSTDVGAIVPGDLNITRVDTSSYPELTIEASVPALLLDRALSTDDVVALENGMPVDIEVTSVPANTLEVVILFDTSGSMNEGASIAFARDAAEQFLGFLPESSQVGIVGFGTSPSLVSPLTANRAQLLQAIRGMRANGKTSMYDALVFGQQLFSGTTEDRHYVVLSDGGDTSSNASLDDALVVATQIRTSVIELVTSESDHDALSRLAAAGNGTLGSVSDADALTGMFREVADDLVNRARVRLTTTASGDTDYTLRLTTPYGVVEATTTVALPAAPTTTVTPATTETTTATVTATTEPAAPIISPPTGEPSAQSGTEEQPAVAVDVGSDDDRRGPSVALLAVGATGFFVGAAVLLGLVFLRPPDPRAARRRLGAQDPAPDAGVGARITRATDRFLERGGRSSRLSAALDAAGISLRPGEFVVLTCTGAVVLALVLFLLAGPVGLLLGPLVAPLTAWAVLRSKTERRRRAFVEQLPDVLQLMVSGLRAGYGLPQVLAAVAEQADAPAADEFQRVLFEGRIGRDPSEALHAAAERMQSDDFRWVVAAIDINREIGGELAQVLEHVGETIRERQRLERQIRTLTAEGRLSAYVLTALPVVLVGVLSLINPGYFEPLTEGVGPVIVGGAVLLMLMGWVWMRRLIRAQL